VTAADRLTLGQELRLQVPQSVLKYGQETLELLKAVWAPKQVVVMHCRGHQKGETTAVLGNQKADREDRQTVLPGGQASASLTAALFLCLLSERDSQYTSQEQAWFENEGGSFLPGGWWKFTNGHIAIPKSLAPTFVKQLLEGTHSGQTALNTTLTQHFYVPELSSISKTVCERFSLCARNNL
jgi:hypothetical protein